MGHGWMSWWRGEDKGAVYKNYTERDLLLPVSLEITKILKEKIPEWLVFDVGINSNARSHKKVEYINMAIDHNNWKEEDCFCLCLHLNSFSKPASGVECRIPQSFYTNNTEKELAKTIISKIIKYYPQKIRWGGVKSKNLYINWINCNTVLIESWFINDENFLEYIKNDPKRLAESICNWYLTFLRMKKLIEK